MWNNVFVRDFDIDHLADVFVRDFDIDNLAVDIALLICCLSHQIRLTMIYHAYALSAASEHFECHYESLSYKMNYN